MNRHDLQSMSASCLVGSRVCRLYRVQAATHMVEFWAQEQRLKRLNEYCDKAVAEIPRLARSDSRQSGPLGVASQSLANTDRVRGARIWRMVKQFYLRTGLCRSGLPGLSAGCQGFRGLIGIGGMSCAHWRSTHEHLLEGTSGSTGF